MNVVDGDLRVVAEDLGRARPISTRRSPPVTKAIADAKGTVKDADQPEGCVRRHPGQVHRCHETFRVKLK